MKGLKVIPMFAGLLILSYLGVLFVRNNPESVVVKFGQFQSPSSALGFVILTSILVGMIVAGVLCSVEMLVLYIQNQKLKRKVGSPDTTSTTSILDSDIDLSFDEEDLLSQDSEEPPERKEKPKVEPAVADNTLSSKSVIENTGKELVDSDLVFKKDK